MITSNRFITFIQSWLVKTSLLFFVCAFVFFSCGDDLNTIGFKPDENRFKVSFQELELPSSVFIPGSVITSNRKGDGLTPRLLVGSYQDDKFGKVSSEAFAQFRPNSTNVIIPEGATLDSLLLNLSFDYYHYGSLDPVNMNFYVHELTDSLITEQGYYQNAGIDYSATPIGLASYGISPSGFDEKYARNTDTDATNNVADSISILIDRSYAELLFKFAKTNSTDYNTFRKFRRIFKGFAIRSDASNQIVGLNPLYDATGIPRSRLLLKYSYVDTVKASANFGKVLRKKIDFNLYADGTLAAVSFSKISVDRSGTSLQNINDLYKDLYPDGNNRFVEAGNAVVTKFDITNFFTFADTIENMLINSAELVIDPVQDSQFTPPNSLTVRVLDSKNHFITASDSIALPISIAYPGTIVNDSEGTLVLGEGSGAGAVIKPLYLFKTDNIYSYKGSFGSYFQMLYNIKDSSKRLSYHALIPGNPTIGKSVSRAVFDKNKFKLRIYYTIPSTKKEK